MLCSAHGRISETFVFGPGPLWKEHCTRVVRTGFKLDQCFLGVASPWESYISFSVLVFSSIKWEQHGVWGEIEITDMQAWHPKGAQ